MLRLGRLGLRPRPVAPRAHLASNGRTSRTHALEQRVHHTPCCATAEQLAQRPARRHDAPRPHARTRSATRRSSLFARRRAEAARDVRVVDEGVDTVLGGESGCGRAHERTVRRASGWLLRGGWSVDAGLRGSVHTEESLLRCAPPERRADSLTTFAEIRRPMDLAVLCAREQRVVHLRDDRAEQEMLGERRVLSRPRQRFHSTG